MEERSYNLNDFFDVRSCKGTSFELPDTVLIEIDNGKGDTFQPFTLDEWLRFRHLQLNPEEYITRKGDCLYVDMIWARMVGRQYRAKEESTFYYIVIDRHKPDFFRKKFV